jgi:caffeoyl-CoA O-methyltransferase
MKLNRGNIIRDEQEQYLDSLLPPRDALCQEMELYSTAHSIPSSDPEALRFLDVCIRSIGATSVLEIGTAIGYGAIGMARALSPGGKVTTIDPSHERVTVARDFLRRANLEDRIEIVVGKALDVLPSLSGPFDLAYLDALKEEYSDYLDLIIPILRVGGVIIADNVLWKGQVATGRLISDDWRTSTTALQEFNVKFMSHPALHSVIVPLGDGLAYGVKI